MSIIVLTCRDAFIKYWVDGHMLAMDVASQIYNILRQPGCEYLRQVYLIAKDYPLSCFFFDPLS